MASLRRTPISPRRLEWLSEQVAAWQQDGVVGEEQARAIRDRYEPNTRTALSSLVVTLGVLFLGAGVLWLVAANHDEWSPLRRFAVVATLWLGCTVGGAMVEGRRGGPLRLLAALLFGGVVFQAAQSLNVPAYEPNLLLAWSAGALALAYALRAHGPVVVGVTAGLGWFVWTLGADSESFAAFTLGLALATPVLAAVAVAHRRDPMGGPWLRAAAVTGLGAPFFASFSDSLRGDPWQRPVWAGLAVALLALVAAAARARARDLGLLAGAALIAAAVLGVVATVPDDPIGFFDRAAGPGALVHALIASAVFVVCAVGVAVAGVVREEPGLVNLAAAALVLFVTLQSFGLFSPLMSGAGLFLVTGSLLVGSGLLVDRGRRRLQEEIEA